MSDAMNDTLLYHFVKVPSRRCIFTSFGVQTCHRSAAGSQWKSAAAHHAPPRGICNFQGWCALCSSLCSQCVSVTGALHTVPVQVTLVDDTAIVAHSRLLCGNVTATSLLQRGAHVAAATHVRSSAEAASVPCAAGQAYLLTASSPTDRWSQTASQLKAIAESFQLEN